MLDVSSIFCITSKFQLRLCTSTPTSWTPICHHQTVPDPLEVRLRKLIPTVTNE